MNPKYRKLNHKNQKQKKPPIPKSVQIREKKQPPSVKPPRKQKNEKRKRDHQGIEDYVKRSLTPFRPITPPQQKNKHN
jgi:hypothetical protein